MPDDSGNVGAAFLTSDLLTQAGFSHAFFTRQGGCSEGPYRSLNFAWSTGDVEARVRENIARASTALGVDAGRTYFLSQVHGVEVVEISAADSWDDIVRREGDAVLSLDPGVACGVRCADCVPVLIGDERSGAALAVHSGWRGTVLDVVGASVAALSRRAPRPELVAAIGPHISGAAFEVGEEVAREIEAASLIPGVVDRVSYDKPHPDLRRMITAQLRACGVSRIDHVEGCTYLDPTRFFSFRRDGARSGRHLAAIVPRKNSL